MFSGLIIIVDLEGVEPSSKQGSHMLSTCLSLPSVFVHKQDQSHSEFAAPLNQTLRNKSF